jgi:uncharacterized membrane protein YfcA
VTILLSLIIGMFAGILGAVLGIGGGIIMLPLANLLLGLDSAIVVGTTLFAVFFTAASGSFGHFKKGNVNVNSGILVGTGGIIGLLPGSWLFKNYLSVNIGLLESLLGFLFLFFALRIGFDFYKNIKGTPDQRQKKNKKQQHIIKPLLLGMITGLFSGVLGLGGGFIMVPGLLMLFSLTPIQAVGTSLFAMMPISFIGGLIKLLQGFVVLPVGISLGIGTIIGAQLGVYVSNFVKPLAFKGMFTFLFLYLAFSYLIK